MAKYTGRKWGIVQTEQEWKFDFDSDPHSNIAEIDWDSALGVQKSSDGSQGVYFVSTTQGSVVIKGSNSIASEVFCAILARRFGIEAPRCRVVARNSEEGTRMYEKIVELDDRQPLYRTARQSLHRHLLLVMEFCSGAKSLKQLSADQLQEYDSQSEIWYKIGKIAAFDMLMRNTDRFPLVVDNRGNAGNVLFGKNGQVFSIDNNCICIDIVRNKDLMIEYCKSVSSFLMQLFQDPTKIHNCTTFVRTTVLQFVGYDIEEKGLIDVQRGIIDFVRQCDEITCEEFSRLKMGIVEVDNQFPDEVQLLGIENIRLDFFHILLEILHSRGHFDYLSALEEVHESKFSKTQDSSLDWLNEQLLK